MHLRLQKENSFSQPIDANVADQRRDFLRFVSLEDVEMSNGRVRLITHVSGSDP